MAKQSSTERSRARRARKAVGLSKKRSARTDAERMRDYRARLRQARKAARKAAKKAAMKPEAPEVLTPAMKRMLKSRLLSMKRSLTGLFTVLMVACAFCGCCTFRNDPGRGMCFKPVAPEDGREWGPAAVANVFIAPYTKDRGTGLWWACPHCREHGGVRQCALAPMSPDYMRAVLAGDPMGMMMLSFIDSPMSLSSWTNSFTHGRVSGNLWDSPLMRFQSTEDGLVEARLDRYVLRVLEACLAHNPYYQSLSCLLHVGFSHYGHPCVDMRFFGPRTLATMHQADGLELYGPVAAAADSYNQQIGVLDSSFGMDYQKHGLFEVGTVHDVLGRPYSITVDHEGSQEACPLPDDLGRSMTLECMWFPWMFSRCRGFFHRAMGGLRSYSAYCRHRMYCWFSCFTLHKMYIPLMWQTRQCNVIANSTSEQVLQKAIHDYRRKHPNATDAEVIRHVAKHKVSGSVVGSPKWHAARLSDVMAMASKWGMPDFFLTFTAGDRNHNGCQWEESKDLEAFLKRFSSSFTWQDAPVESAMLFKRKLDTTIKNFLPLKKPGALGRVMHYVIRLEVQARGSLHAHIVLWVHPDDLELASRGISGAVPGVWVPNEVTGGGTFVPPPGATEQDKELLRLVLAHQQHTCYHRCNKQGFCKDGFPFAAQEERDPQWDAGKGRYTYYRPGYEHRNISPYHPALLLAWGAHMNLQRIANCDWSLYLLKYAMKASFVQDVTVDKSVAEQLGLHNVSDEMLHLLSVLVLAKPVSPCEAAAHMAGINIYQASDKVDFVPSQPEAMRAHFVNENSTRLSVPPVDTYCARPEQFHNLTFTQYFSRFLVTKKKYKRLACRGTDEFGNNVYERPADQPVRFSVYNPGVQPDAFFYNVLLDYVPFTAEADLWGPDNVKTKDAFKECMRFGIITSEDDLQEVVDKHAMDNLIGEDNVMNIMEQLVDFKVLAQAGGSACGMVGGECDEVHVDEATEAALLSRHAEDMEELREAAAVKPTKAQKKILNKLKRATAGVHVVSGGPGTGKTFVTRHLVHHFRNAGKKTIVCATSGPAATRICKGAKTVHSAFGVFGGHSSKGKYLSSLSPVNPLYSVIACADVIIIDEMSMLSSDLMGVVLYRIKTCCGFRSIDEVYKKKLIILVGDHCQLPPVCNHQTSSTEFCSLCHLSSHPVWNVAVKHVLRHSVRHAADRKLSKFLDIIRVRQPTQEEIDACFSYPGAQVTLEQALEMADRDTTVLCTNVKPMADINDRVMATIFPKCKVHKVELTTNVPLRNKRAANWLAAAGFHTLTSVAVGARVMLTHNRDIRRGAVNGATAVVTKIEYGPYPPSCWYEGHPQQTIVAVHIKLSHSGEVLRVGRTKNAYFWDAGGVRYKKASFPLAPAYAITGHKAQGATLSGRTIVNVTDAFCPGLLYVMLSRVPTTARLHVLQRLTPDMFKPMLVPGMC